MQRDFVFSLLFGYYAATVVFAVLDVGLDINVRLAFLENSPGWRTLYYLVCIACAALMQWRPDLSVFIGAAEGLVTIVALILSVAPRAMMVSADIARPIDVETMLNFLISGAFAYLSWWRGMAAFRRLVS